MYAKRCRSSTIFYLVFAATIITAHANSSVELGGHEWPLAALSQQGHIDFSHAYKQLNTPSYFSPDSYRTSSDLSQFKNSAPYEMRSAAGPIAVSCSTDPLSCFNLLCDAPRIGSALLNTIIKGCSRIFDTTGFYKQQRETTFIEQFLYAVDTHRLELYTHIDLSNAIIRDRQYLEDLKQEIRLTLYTRTAPPGLYHAYCLLEDYVTDAWRALMERCSYAPSPLEQAQHTVRMACKAVDFVTKAPIKNKKGKAQIVAQYTEALAFARKQLSRIEEAYTAQTRFDVQQDLLIDYCTELYEYVPSERIAHRLELLYGLIPCSQWLPQSSTQFQKQ